MYFEKIFNFLEIDKSNLKEIIYIHENKKNLLNQKSFKSNLKKNLYRQTLNNKSNELRKIIKSDKDVIKFFNSKVKYPHNKYEIKL